MPLDIARSFLVFPEYAAMELAAIDTETASDLHASLRAVVALGSAD